MPNKPIKQSYKIYGIANHGYLYNFLWSSQEKEYQDIFRRPGLIKTACLIRNLALSLPRQHLTVYMDNYFTSVPLFSELRACKFGAVGITRPHKEFPISCWSRDNPSHFSSDYIGSSPFVGLINASISAQIHAL